MVNRYVEPSEHGAKLAIQNERLARYLLEKIMLRQRYSAALLEQVADFIKDARNLPEHGESTFYTFNDFVKSDELNRRVLHERFKGAPDYRSEV